MEHKMNIPLQSSQKWANHEISKILLIYMIVCIIHTINLEFTCVILLTLIYPTPNMHASNLVLLNKERMLGALKSPIVC